MTTNQNQSKRCPAQTDHINGSESIDHRDGLQLAQAELADLRDQHAAAVAAEAAALGQVQQLQEFQSFRIAEVKAKGQEPTELQEAAVELHKQLQSTRQELARTRTRLQVRGAACQQCCPECTQQINVTAHTISQRGYCLDQMSPADTAQELGTIGPPTI